MLRSQVGDPSPGSVGRVDCDHGDGLNGGVRLLCAQECHELVGHTQVPLQLGAMLRGFFNEAVRRSPKRRAKWLQNCELVRPYGQCPPYIGTETVEDLAVAVSVTLITTQAGPCTRVIPGNELARSAHPVTV